MPCSHYFDLRKGVIFVTSTGTVNDHDWVANLTAMVRDENFHPELRGFSDYTGVTESLVTANMLELLAANQASSPRARWAFLVTPGFSGAMIEFYKSQIKRGQVQLFLDRSKAFAWLNESVPQEQVIV